MKGKTLVWYGVSMAILLYGVVVILGSGAYWKDGVSLIVWAISYGWALANSAYHGAKTESQAAHERAVREGRQ